MSARELAPGQADVWRADLDGPDPGYWRSFLDDAELSRAARFHFEEDARHYATARGMLRELLGQYLGIEPQSVVFRYAESGKPAVDRPETDLQFNVSHSRERGLFAFARGRGVGVDIEQGARLGGDLGALTRRVFSARERVRWLLRPESERRDAFLDGWTRKEALLKASGRGIVDGLQDMEAPAGMGPDPMRAPGPKDRPGEVWTLWDLREFAGCAAALALEGIEPASVQMHDVRSSPCAA